MVAELLAAGAAAETILAAVRGAELAAAAARRAGSPVESPVDKTAERRRAYDRERKRNLRKSGGIPPESPVDTNSATSLRDNINNNITKKEEARRKRGAEIPPDWNPTEKHFEIGAELGLDVNGIRQAAEDMRLWAQANRHRAVARKSDWDLTFTTWLRRTAGERSRGPPPSRRPQGYLDLALELEANGHGARLGEE